MVPMRHTSLARSMRAHVSDESESRQWQIPSSVTFKTNPLFLGGENIRMLSVHRLEIRAPPNLCGKFPFEVVCVAKYLGSEDREQSDQPNGPWATMRHPELGCNILTLPPWGWTTMENFHPNRVPPADDP